MLSLFLHRLSLYPSIYFGDVYTERNFLFSSTFFCCCTPTRCQMKTCTNKLVCLSFVFCIVYLTYNIFYFPLSFLVLLSCVLDFHLVYSGTLLFSAQKICQIYFYLHWCTHTRATRAYIKCMGERLTTVSIKSEMRSRSSDQIKFVSTSLHLLYFIPQYYIVYSRQGSFSFFSFLFLSLFRMFRYTLATAKTTTTTIIIHWGV